MLRPLRARLHQPTTWRANLASPVRRKIGLNVHGVDQRAISLLTNLGVTQVRYTIQWNMWVDGRADYKTPALAGLDRLRAAAIDVLVVVHAPPMGKYTLATGIPAMCQLMADLVTQRRGLTWQILNEMDGDDTFNGGWFEVKNTSVTSADRGALYGQLLGPVYDAIKAADPTATVVTGGTALDPVPFYLAVRDHAPGKYDALCVHSYSGPLVKSLAQHSIVMRKAFPSTPLWATEWGLNTPDDRVQADAIGPVLDDNDASHRYDRSYLYVLMSDDNLGDHYGIVQSDGRLRAAAALLRDRTGS